VTNIGNEVLKEVYIGTFFDFDAGHITESGYPRSEDDITFYIDSLQTAIGGDPDGTNMAAKWFGVMVLQTPKPQVTVAYKNFERVRGGDPPGNVDKYNLMASGTRDPDTFGDLGDWRFVFAFGPLGDLAPNETLPVTIAIVNGFDIPEIITNSRQALAMFQADFRGPSAPNAPVFFVEPMDRAVKITWQDNAEASVDPITKTNDFEGYRIWRTPDGFNYILVAEFDKIDGIGPDRGMPQKNAQGLYEFIDKGLPNGFPVSYAVTSFDNGDNGDGIHHPEWDRATGGVGELESSRGVDVQKLVTPATAVQASVGQVFVVPNPYVGSSRLEQITRYDRQGNPVHPKVIEFRNLPARAKIQVFSLAGDLVQELDHTNGLSWELWDLRTRLNQEIAAGIYFFRVEGEDGKEQIGKFIVVK